MNKQKISSTSCPSGWVENNKTTEDWEKEFDEKFVDEFSGVKCVCKVNKTEHPDRDNIEFHLPETIKDFISQAIKQAEVKPEQLHKWYLEAVKELKPESFNPNANKNYDELTDEQKFIDKYIADKINSLKEQ